MTRFSLRNLISCASALLIGSALTLASPARAEIPPGPFMLEGDPQCWLAGQPCMGLLGGEGSLALSATALSQFQSAGLLLSIAEPTTRNGDVLTMPVLSLAPNPDPDLGVMHVGSYRFAGGLVLRNGEAASLEIRNIKADLLSKSIYGSLVSENERVTHVRLADFSTIEGATVFSPIPENQSLSQVLSGWRLTSDALQRFQHALQLSDAQVGQLGQISDGGTLRINATLYTVPEPSTWALLGLGLCGLFAAQRRARDSV